MSVKIEQYDSTTRWIAYSETDKGESYIIDLHEWSCTCAHHICRVFPEYRKGNLAKEKATCKHMDRLIRQLGIGCAEALVQNEIESERQAKINPISINKTEREYPF